MLKLFACGPFSNNASVLDEPQKDYKRVDFDVHQPTYFVKYLGCEDLYKPGIPEICSTVKSIYSEKKRELKALDHFSLTLSKQELALRDNDSTEDQETVFGLRRILYCGVYRPKQTLFFYNYQFGSKADQLKCHVVLCRDKEDAKSLAKVIGAAFKEVQHDVHKEDVAYRRLHAQGLSNSSTLRDCISNVEANRRLYYNLNFEGKPLKFSSSRASTAELATGKSLAAKNKHTHKRRSRSDSSHLDFNTECERTESSQDNNAQNSDDTASMDHNDCEVFSLESPSSTTLLISTRRCCCEPSDSDIIGPIRGDGNPVKALSDSTLYACSEESSNRTLVSYDDSSAILTEDDCDWTRVSELSETEL